MSKKQNANFLILFFKSLKLYFANFPQFFKYMTFPVIGQVLSLLFIFTISYFYSKNLPFFMQKFNSEENSNILLVFIPIIIILPFLIVYIKAFWEYLIAYGAINSMLENMLKSGRVYDFNAHTELIKRRTPQFIGLWIIIGIFSLFSITPFLCIPCAVIFIYMVLIFQVFVYEPELSPIGCIKRSFNLIKGHFATTFVLLSLAGGITYILLPYAVLKLSEISHFTDICVNFATPFFTLFPLDKINDFTTKFNIKIDMVYYTTYTCITSLIAMVFIQYTLPLRSILFGLWYKALNDKPKSEIPSYYSKKNNIKPSEKLMKNSHKKFSSKKLDKNILRRAMEKDED